MIARLLFISLCHGFMLRSAIVTPSRWSGLMWLSSVTFSMWVVSNEGYPVWLCALAYVIMSLFGWLIIHAWRRTFRKGKQP